MSVLNYIEEKKAQFKSKLEARRTNTMERKKLALKELELQNKKRNEELKLERALEKEKLNASSLKKEARGYTLAGKIGNKFKERMAEAKKRNASRMKVEGSSGGLFTSGSLGKNVFTSSSGSLGKNVFSGISTEKPTNKIKSKTIVKYR